MAEKVDNIMIRLSGVDKSYDENRVVKNVNLDIREGEFLTLLGPSGCGKTTTLRMIAGFEDVSRGEIFLQGENVGNTKPHQRDVNTVFQNYALFPHMTVADNIAFGLVEKKVPKAEIKARVNEMLTMVQLEGMEKGMPSQMSGGQKQRVAIARALINRPKVLLLDEPLGALDLKLRKQMQFELKHLQKKLGITFIYVTHDQEEALTMSDRIAVMNNGILEQVGEPEEIYNRPVTKFVADFIGETNVLEAYVQEVQENSIKVVFESGHAVLSVTGFVEEEMVYVCIRPENLRISASPVDGFNIQACVKEHIFIGSVNKTIMELPTGQDATIASHPEQELFATGSKVYLYWTPAKGVILHTREEKLYNLIDQEVSLEKQDIGASDE